MRGRDSRGRFARGSAPWNKLLAPLAPPAPPGLIGGGVMRRERALVTCPACGQRVEAVAWDGRVKGYCAVAGHYVNFPVETQLTAEIRAKISAANKGKRRDDETKAKISAAHRGKHPTAETKAKISAALKRRFQEQRPGS